jgi:UDP-2,3-diacylglucosamine hydrolase
MTVPGHSRTVAALDQGAPLAIICGGGSLPYTVAAAARERRRSPVLFGLTGFADPQAIAAYPHHWIRPGQFGRFRRLARAEGCREVTMIGSVVRPTLRQLWPDFAAAVLLPRLLTLFRGGDDRLLRGVAAICEENGFRLVGAHEIAPEILMPAGALGQRQPDQPDRSDIATALAVLRATSPFDIGQGAVVADGRVLAIEAAEGTDAMLAHLAALRRSGRIRAPTGRGVLVKAPKTGQDRRFDLPSIGPRTVEGAVAAGLSGIAVVAGSTVVAEPDRIAGLADRCGVFVVGLDDEGASA